MSSSNWMSWVRNNVKTEDITKLVGEHKGEALEMLKNVDKDDVKNVLDKAANKLDTLANQESADGSVSKSVLGFFSKSSGAPATSSDQKSLKSRAVSLAIKNWRYSIPFVMSSFWFVMSWAWVLIILVPIYMIVKKRMGSKAVAKSK